MTQSTVKTHVGHILDKLGLRDRVHAVVFGYEHGLVEPGTYAASRAGQPAARRSAPPRPRRKPG